MDRESNSQGESTRPSGADTTKSSESVKSTPSGETSNVQLHLQVNLEVDYHNRN